MGDYIFNGAVYLIAIGFLIFSFVKDKHKTRKALLKAWKAFENILPMLLGIIIVFILGSVAAGPLYAAFPIAAVLMKKGAKFSNVLIFIGAWSTTKIPMFLFEMSAMGIKFTVTRLLIDIPGIIIIAYAIYFMISKKERGKIYSLDEKNPGTI